MIVAERGSGRMTYAKKKEIKPFAEHDLRVTLQRAGNKSNKSKKKKMRTFNTKNSCLQEIGDKF